MSGGIMEITTDGDTGGSRETLEVTVNSSPSPVPLPVSPPRSSRATSPPNSPGGKSSKLAKVSEELLFESEGFLKISGRIHIKNLTLPSSTIVFKIKTTNPGKFHVWPTIGLISDRGSAVSKVTLKPNIDVHSVRHDKFQVEVMIVPKELLSNIQAIEDEDQYGNSDSMPGRRDRRSSLAGEPGHSVSTLAELNESWKKIAATGTSSETHRVSITVDPSFLQPVEPPSPEVPERKEEDQEESKEQGGNECSQRIEGLERRLDSLDDNMMEQFLYLQYLIYGLMGALLVFSLVNFGAYGVGELFVHVAPENIKNVMTFWMKGSSSDNPGPKFFPQPQQPEQMLPAPAAPPTIAFAVPASEKVPFKPDICPLFG
jgi:hypothetical protein